MTCQFIRQASGLFRRSDMARRFAVPRRGAGLARLLAQQHPQQRLWYVYRLHPLSVKATTDPYVNSSSCATTGAPEGLYPSTNKTSPSTLLKDKKTISPSFPPITRTQPTSLSRPQNKAGMATVTESPTGSLTKPNVGVFTDPEHKLWVAESGPSLESVKKGESLKEGEVTVGIKSTGICGYLIPSCSGP